MCGRTALINERSKQIRSHKSLREGDRMERERERPYRRHTEVDLYLLPRGFM